MYKHHEDTINNIVTKLKQDDEVLGVVLGGSLAHGFYTEKSDVDIFIVISNEDYKKRTEESNITYGEVESATYEGGYIDAKYICTNFMELVAQKGSEPARYAFDGAKVLYSRIDGLEELINRITTYPVEKKEENIRRFYAQFEGYRWFCHEGISHDNEYLLNHSVSNLILFGGRLILAYNELLYPYHKWYLKVLSEAKQKPEDLMDKIDNLLKNKDAESIDEFVNCINDFYEWNKEGYIWTNQFVKDSELNWLYNNMNVADI